MQPDLSCVRPVILCGGLGKRLAPLSTPDKPKPFLSLLSNKTMLQETLLRVGAAKSPVILCGHKHASLVKENLLEIGIHEKIILEEPAVKNTGPAAALAARYFQQKNPDEILLFLPSDHEIKDLAAFLRAVEQSVIAARNGQFVLFGERPDCPDTDYGYIQSDCFRMYGLSKVQHFCEKPSHDVAEKYIQQGYLWNTGIVMVCTDTLLTAFERHSSEIWNLLQHIDCCNISEALFSQMPSVSLDYALLEKIDNCMVCPVEMGWSDIGTLDRLQASA